MGVYVDDMREPLGRMIMCHMVADTDQELHAMAARIGVARKWHQKPGTAHSHYDIALSKRALAVAAGAQEIDRRGLADHIKKKRAALAGGAA
jgi:prolyl-tRNA editing enzyme YbaK/EbsC (Cys-tRNA(Pro) deacylase)